MKKLVLIIASIFLLTNINVLAAEKNRSLLEKILNRDLPGGPTSSKREKALNNKKNAEIKEKISVKCQNQDDKSILE